MGLKTPPVPGTVVDFTAAAGERVIIKSIHLFTGPTVPPQIRVDLNQFTAPATLLYLSPATPSTVYNRTDLHAVMDPGCQLRIHTAGGGLPGDAFNCLVSGYRLVLP